MEATDDRVQYAIFAKKLSDSMITSEEDNYVNFRKILKSVGVDIDEKGESKEVVGIR